MAVAYFSRIMRWSPHFATYRTLLSMSWCQMPQHTLRGLVGSIPWWVRAVSVVQRGTYTILGRRFYCHVWSVYIQACWDSLKKAQAILVQFLFYRNLHSLSQQMANPRRAVANPDAVIFTVWLSSLRQSWTFSGFAAETGVKSSNIGLSCGAGAPWQLAPCQHQQAWLVEEGISVSSAVSCWDAVIFEGETVKKSEPPCPSFFWPGKGISIPPV